MQPDREGSGVRRVPPEADSHLCVTFRDMPPSEELLHFARRRATRLAAPATGPLQLTVERDGRRHHVQLSVAGASTAVEEVDEDALLAIRNVFDRFSAEHPPGPTRAVATQRRAWPPAGALLTARRRRLLELGAALEIAAGVLLEGEREAGDALREIHARCDDAMHRWLTLEAAWLRRLEGSQIDPPLARARRQRVAAIAQLRWGMRQRPPGSAVELALAARHLVGRVEAYLHGLDLAWLALLSSPDRPPRAASSAATVVGPIRARRAG